MTDTGSSGEYARPRTPTHLRRGGRKLFDGIADVHELDPQQLVQLVEACRAKDRLDQLDQVLRGDVDTWSQVLTDTDTGDPVSLRIDSALQRANDTANVMKQLLAAMRLPDEVTGKRPQRRPARGTQRPDIPGGSAGKVSSLDRARSQRTS